MSDSEQLLQRRFPVHTVESESFTLSVSCLLDHLFDVSCILLGREDKENCRSQLYAVGSHAC